MDGSVNNDFCFILYGAARAKLQTKSLQVALKSARNEQCQGSSILEGLLNTHILSIIEVLEAISQFTELSEQFVLDLGAGDISDPPGMAIRWADSKYTGLSRIIITEPIDSVQHLQQQLETASQYMKKRRGRGQLIVFEKLIDPTVLAGVDENASVCGLHRESDYISVAAPARGSSCRVEVAGLKFVRVSTQAQLITASEIVATSYGLTRAAAHELFSGSSLLTKDAVTLLGYLDGKPVSTAAAIAVQGRLHLALCATVPQAPRRGVAAATIAETLSAGSKQFGSFRALAYAPVEDLPLYDAVGFHATATIRRFRMRGVAS